jgi:hypothetical protein
MGKRRDHRRDPDRPGVIEDLEDQAAWSSYGSHIPRAGDPYRQHIWSNRFGRMVKHFPALRFVFLFVVILGVAMIVYSVGTAIFD